jgi:dihydrofolate reductase
MRNIVYIAASLDGFIARQDGSLDWLTGFPNPENLDYGFAEFMAGVDAVLMGRLTYETVLGFEAWPYAKPVFVLSGTLKGVAPALAGKAEVVCGPLRDLLAGLERRGIKRLYVDGGRTVQSFLREDLVDELTVSRLPLLLGGGRPLFGPLGAALAFTHAGTEVYPNGIIKSRYLRNRGS